MSHHTSLIGISLRSLLLNTQWASAPAFPTGLGAGAGTAGSFPQPAAPAASALAFAAPAPASTAPAGVSGVRALVAGVVLLVLDLALDNPGLVVTAGALNPIDVLVVGHRVVRTACNCYLKESGFIVVYASTIVLSCPSARALMLSSKGIEIELMMRAFRCYYIRLSSNQQNIHLMLM